MKARLREMGTGKKVALGAAGMLALLVLLAVLFPSQGRNPSFQPQDEFKLDPWIPIKLGPLDMSINKAVLYLLLASALTIGIMTYIARRMQEKPNRVQTAIEALYDLTRNQITRSNMDERMAGRYFAFVATLFFFIWFSNLLGYVPLPVSPHHVDIFGLKVPALAIYAATANLSVPLMLTLVVFFLYQAQGIKAKGPVRYFKDWIPQGTPKAMRIPIFFIEVISQFVRIISLSVRLFANILAGHLLILFMAGGLAVILGFAAIAVLTTPIAVVFFIFEIVLIATLQAFIFSILTAIYLGEAVAEAH